MEFAAYYMPFWRTYWRFLGNAAHRVVRSDVDLPCCVWYIRFTIADFFQTYSYEGVQISETFISVIDQLDAQSFCFTISVFHASTCFEHMCSSPRGKNCITQPLISSHLFLFYNKFISCLYMFRAHVLITKRSKLHYKASGIITPNFCFTISLFHASTCFEHMCSSSGGQNCITQPLVSSHL